MNLPDINIAAILPAIILVVTGMAVMVADPFLERGRKASLGWLALAGIGAATASLVPMASNVGAWYAGLWWVDGYSVFFHGVFLLIAAMTILMAMDYLKRENLPPSEFTILVLFSTTGALLMAGAGELMLIFIGIEILSIATYVLAGYRRTETGSNESALKYFLLGSFASAFFLYGVALVFGATGSTNLARIAEAVANGTAQMSLVYPAAGLMLVSLGFKVALAPFHVWTPDVYEGAPTPVTGFMSVAPKAAGFAVFMRIFVVAFPAIEDRWVMVLWVVAAATMIVGNVAAIVQTNIKRMLAYSSIAHAGYIAVAFAASSEEGLSAAMFYMLAYAVMNLGAFAIVTVLARTGDGRTDLADYGGLASRRPGLAALLTVFLLSLAGIPGTAGFAGKFLIFASAIESGLLGLTVIAVLTTVVSFYYYLYVIVEMYMKEPTEAFGDVSMGSATGVVLLFAVIATLYLGLLPARAIAWALESGLIN